MLVYVLTLTLPLAELIIPLVPLRSMSVLSAAACPLVPPFSGITVRPSAQ